MFLFIKKSARKHEGKKNIKSIFGQRGENVVGGDPLTSLYPSWASGMEIERSEVLTRSAVVVPK